MTDTALRPADDLPPAVRPGAATSAPTPGLPGGLDARFATDGCLNCGTALTGPFCAACGQKKATRLGAGTVRSEAWQMLRWFEMDIVKSGLRLAMRPGTVAREYVLGVRKAHVHPLKLLLLAIGVLLLVLNQTQYLSAGGQAAAEVSRAYALLREYSKWSFSLGIVAIFGSAWLVFRGRLGYNATEILALAIYCHFLAIVLHTLNQLPLLVFTGADALAAHKRWSARYMTALNALVVLVAFKQFFLVDLRREGWRLLLAGGLYAAIKWAVSQLYARLVVEIVMWQIERNPEGT